MPPTSSAPAETALFLFPIIIGLGSVSLLALTGARPPRRGICNVTPTLQPPGWVFSVVWPILYLLLGGALVLVWRAGGRQWTAPVFLFLFAAIFALQAWWWTFSTICRPRAAFVSLLAIAVGFALFALWAALHRDTPTYRTVALLILPLVAWTSFASFLSYQIVVGQIRV